MMITSMVIDDSLDIEGDKVMIYSIMMSVAFTVSGHLQVDDQVHVFSIDASRCQVS